MQIEQDGKTIEVFTAEELKAKQDEAVAAAISPIQTELESAKDQLKGLTDKDFNFSTLRQKISDLEAAQATAKQDALAEFESKNLKDMATDAIIRLADGDEELKKKLEFHYNRLGSTAKSAEEVKQAVRESFVLSRQADTGPDPLAGAFSAGDGGPIMPKKEDPSRPALTDNQRSFLKAAYPDMTDEQIKALDASAKPPKVGAIDGNFAKRVI